MSRYPSFIDPGETVPEDAIPAVFAGNRNHPVLDVAGTPVEVVSFAPEPSLVNLPRHEAAFMKAVGHSLGDRAPETEAIRSWSRAAADPAAALAKLGAPLDWTGTAHGRVLSVRADVLSCAVLPGPQPRGRTGREYRSASEPVIEHTPTGQIRLTFDSIEHLRNWMVDTTARTAKRAIDRGRHQEIAATGVRRDIHCHLAVLSFRDGSVDQYVVLVRDGISRWTGAHVLRLGLAKAPARSAAERIVDELVPLDKLTSTTDTRALSKHLYAVSTKVQAEYEAGVTKWGESERSILLRQANRMPATTYLALSEGDAGLAAALDRIVLDVHTDVAPWEQQDADYHQARTVLEAMHDAGTLPDAVHALVSAPAGAGLERAVTIAAYGMGSGFVDIKAEMRHQGMYKAVRARRVSELLGPVLTEPWSLVKGVGNVWGYDGALPELAPGLQPTHPADYLDLVPLALAGDTGAKDELHTAGAIALISNGVVTTAIIGGSGGSKNQGKRRMSLTSLFADICKTEIGLTQLAIAANTFDPTEVNNLVPAVDLDAADRIKRDGAGVPTGPDGKPGLTWVDLIDIALLAGNEDEGEDGADPQEDAAVEAGRAVDRGLEDMESALSDLKSAVNTVTANRQTAGRTHGVISASKSSELGQDLFDLLTLITDLSRSLP